MKVRACTNFPLSLDGVNAVLRQIGDEFEVPDDMAKGLIFEGYVEMSGSPVVEKNAAPFVENKDMGAVPENKGALAERRRVVKESRRGG